MKKLSLNRDGSLHMLGFTDYQEYKSYKERAAASPGKVVFMGEPAWVKAIVLKQWVNTESNMLSGGSFFVL